MNYADFHADLLMKVDASGMTQQEVGRLAGIPQRTISNIISGGIPRADKMLSLWPIVYGSPLARPLAGKPPAPPADDGCCHTAHAVETEKNPPGNSLERDRTGA